MGLVEKVKSLFGNNVSASTGGRFFVNGDDIQVRKLQEQAKASWAYIAMNAIAKEVATTPLKLYKEEKGEVIEVEEHEALEKLQEPNAAQSDYDISWLTVMHGNSLGESYWIFDDETQDYTVVSSEFAELKFDTDGTLETLTINNKVYKGENVIIYRNPSITDPLRGCGMLSAISATVDIDTFLEDHLRTFFYNNATPQGFLVPESKEGITEEFRKRLVVALNYRHRGVSKAHKFGILEKQMKWIQTGVSLSDQRADETSELVRKKILAAFGVPEAILGITDGVRANTDVADSVFARRTIRPTLKMLEKTLNRFYLTRFEDTENMFLRYDEVVLSDRKLDAEINAMYLTAGVITTDEVREELGLDPLDEKEEEETNEEKLLNVLKSKKKKELEDKKIQEEEDRVEMKTSFTGKEITAYHEKKISYTSKLEEDMQKQLEGYFARQMGRVIRSIKARKAQTENLEYNELSTRDKELLEAIIRAYVVDSAIFQSKITNGLLGISDGITAHDKGLKAYTNDRVKKTTVSVLDDVQKRIDKTILEAETVKEATENVTKLYEKEITPN